MLDLAHAARTSLDPGLMARIRQRGEAAVGELRALLDMLRAPPPAVPPPTAAPASAPWRGDALTAALLSCMVLGEWAYGSSSGPFPAGLLAVTAAVSVRRVFTTLSSLVAAFGFVAVWLTSMPFVTGPALAASLTLITWSAVASPSRRRTAALLVLAGSCLLATLHEPDNSLVVATSILTGSAIGSRIWHRLEAEHTAARARSETYSHRLSAAVDEAAARQRLDVARDLHDVASRAIAVMLLHTSVAEVNSTRDPAVAREALDTVVSAGDSALTELASLDRALRLDGAEDLRTALAAEVERLRAAGLDVRLEMTARPRDADTAEVAWRTAHEAMTNALKHARGSRVETSVHREGDDLVVSVRDDGAGHPSTGTGRGMGTGSGLLGLTQRVRQHGGSLRYGPRPYEGGTGFEVVARLPQVAEVPPDPAAESLPALGELGS
jgi:signal transduction histidine kinase